MRAKTDQTKVKSREVLEAMVGSVGVAPISQVPASIDTRPGEAGAHSDSLTHGDSGSHVDAHGDHGDQ